MHPSATNRERHGADRRSSIAAGIMLVLVCAAAAAYAVVSELQCLNEGFPTAPFICTNSGEHLAAWYHLSLAVAAMIPLIGVWIGHVRRRRWPAVLAGLLSLTVTAISMAWAFHRVTNLA